MHPACPLLFRNPVLRLNALFDQLPCTFHCDPFEKASSGVPNVHAHLSEFSAPPASNHASRWRSVSISDISWPLTFASAASPWLCRPDPSSGSQPASPSRAKKNANLTVTPFEH